MPGAAQRDCSVGCRPAAAPQRGHGSSPSAARFQGTWAALRTDRIRVLSPGTAFRYLGEEKPAYINVFLLLNFLIEGDSSHPCWFYQANKTLTSVIKCKKKALYEMSRIPFTVIFGV